jgi:subtilase family serine protease
LPWNTLSAAQQPVQPARTIGPVDENQLVTLSGNIPPAAAIAANDRGPVSPNLPMTDLVLVLNRSAAQQAAFDAFVASQYDLSSPNFHRWLTPDEVGATYGPAEADIATISDWLSERGFHVDQVAPDRMSIRFSGTAHAG